MSEVQWMGIVHEHDLNIVHIDVIVRAWTSDFISHFLCCFFELESKIARPSTFAATLSLLPMGAGQQVAFSDDHKDCHHNH
jgi:hypothetical protein